MASMSWLGPLNICKKGGNVHIHAGATVRTHGFWPTDLCLLDSELDLLDGVSVDVVADVHLLPLHQLRPDNCKDTPVFGENWIRPQLYLMAAPPAFGTPASAAAWMPGVCVCPLLRAFHRLQSEAGMRAASCAGGSQSANLSKRGIRIFLPSAEASGRLAERPRRCPDLRSYSSQSQRKRTKIAASVEKCARCQTGEPPNLNDAHSREEIGFSAFAVM